MSLRLVQTIPYYLTKSEHFGKNWEEALKEAFGKAQEELEEFCTLVMETDVFAGAKTVYKREPAPGEASSTPSISKLREQQAHAWCWRSKLYLAISQLRNSF